ncbi:MAG: DUF1284 domain-containing protein [Chloroflexi bacterium]|nr:DUF1284 domain-containing protein [Chloroflexota bacterium]
MADASAKHDIALRAHHICCLRFLRGADEERGEGYVQTRERLKAVLCSDAEIAVREGVDELCLQCKHCVEGRCQSTRGDETGVRKWDAILLKELGVPQGARMTARRWQELIEAKAPFKLCQRCQWRHNCDVWQNGTSKNEDAGAA